MSGWIAGFYFICKLGDDVTESYQKISDALYDCPWYAMPVKIRKHFPTIMLVAQRPIYLYGYFNIRCKRMTFRKVWFWFLLWILSFPLQKKKKICSLFSDCERCSVLFYGFKGNHLKYSIDWIHYQRLLLLYQLISIINSSKFVHIFLSFKRKLMFVVKFTMLTFSQRWLFCKYKNRESLCKNSVPYNVYLV